MKQKKLLVGAHVSTAGGIQEAPKRAHTIGCNAVQIFCASPQIWSKNPVPAERITGYKVNAPKFGIEATVIHAQYLINLASVKPELLEKSRLSLSVDMDAAAKIGAVGVVVHVGSHMGLGWDAVKEQVAREITGILERSNDKAVFLIENSAGQNGKIASDLREIRWLMDTVQGGKRLGWCLDSCHAYCAGYSLVKMEGEKYLFDWIEDAGIAKELKVVHVNESRDEYHSARDRHANLGEGKIGDETLRAFLHNPMLSGLPFILEVPALGSIGLEDHEVAKLKVLLE